MSFAPVSHLQPLRWVLISAMLATLSLTGCAGIKTASPDSPNREGLFDKFSKMRSPSGRSSLGSRRNPGGKPRVIEISKEIQTLTADWQWPLKAVSVTSEYGQRGDNFHDGVDLKARSGTPVYAASAGTVLYSGSKIRGYGKMVVIKHGKNLSTVYAHNSKLLVKKGQRVKRGQKISISGNTGRSRGPHLHFEVRDGVAALDPLAILGNKAASTRTVANRE